MSNLEAIAGAIDYIETHLREPIAVIDVAQAVSFSLYHFCRLFNAMTHHTPYNYMIRRRLAESALELLRTNRKVIDIAGDYQFDNPETFARAFRRVFDLQPSQLRKQASIDPRRVMPRLTPAHLQHLAQGAVVRPVAEDKEAFQIVGLMTLVKSSNCSAISELWTLLEQELTAYDSLDCYGIAFYPSGWQDRGRLYMAGVRLDAPDLSKSALVVRSIPALKWARFTHKGPTETLPLTLDYIYHTWAPKSGLRIDYSMVVEHWTQNLLGAESTVSEREIYIPLENEKERPRGV